MDTDYAQSTAELARAMILDQAGAAMLSQANQQPMYVLSLLS
jgi:flagellin